MSDIVFPFQPNDRDSGIYKAMIKTAQGELPVETKINIKGIAHVISMSKYMSQSRISESVREGIVHKSIAKAKLILLVHFLL